MLPDEQVSALITQFGGAGADRRPRGADDRGPERRGAPFEFDPFERHRLLNGLDDIGLTLQHEAAIAAYEAAHRG